MTTACRKWSSSHQKGLRRTSTKYQRGPYDGLVPRDFPAESPVLDERKSKGAGLVPASSSKPRRRSATPPRRRGVASLVF
jgi:hypothetical protein